MNWHFEPNLPLASTLPSSYYFDPGILAEENRRVFGTTWQLAGRAEQVREPGQYFTATVADEPAVDPDRFFGLENPALVDRWASAPRGVAPEEQLLAAETQAIISRAIEALPLAQREVITLRDMEGWSAADVCNALELTETNQRVLLHRARSKVRAAVEPYLSPTA